MTDWLGTFLDISARCGDKLLQPRPAWVWARDGSTILWSNPTGADLLGIESLDQLKNLNLEPNNSLRRDVGNLARRLGNEGTLARLRFFRGAMSVSLACSCKRFRLPDGRATILIEASGNVERGSAADDEQLARFLSIDGEKIFILDGNRSVLASTGANAGSGADELPETFDTNGPQIVQVNTDNGTLSVRYVATGNNEEARILVWAKTLADSPSEPDETEAETAEGQKLSGEQTVQPTETGQAAGDGRPDDILDRPETGTQETGQQDAAELEVAEQEIEHGAEQDDMPLPDIGLPKIPGKPIEDDDTNGDFGRQARMLRAALRKSVENVAESDAEPWPEVLDSLPKKPVRFLWQTDADDRFLFVSPGLEELVGRSSRIVGEKWDDIADRMRLDPVGRVSEALAAHDTWSGYTAWWPTDDCKVRIPAELTALPVFAIDQTFQGYRGFGVLKPAEALSAAAFDKRFPGDPLKLPDEDPLPAGSEVHLRSPSAETTANVVPIRDDLQRLPDFARLSPQERSAFDEIALALKTHDEITHSLSRSDDSNASAVPAEEDQSDSQFVAGESAGQPGEYGDFSSDPNDPDFLASLPDDEDDYPPDADEIYADDFEALAPFDDPFGPEKKDLPKPGPADVQPPPANDDHAVALSAPAETGSSELAHTAGKLEAVLDIAADGILVLDETGTILQHNAIAQAFVGDVDDKIVGRPLADLLHEDSRQSTRDYLDGLRENGVESVLRAGREVSVRKGDEIVPLYMKIGRLAHHEPDTRFGVVIRDISRWKNVEADLIAGRQAAEQASEQKSEFLARVSHEIRTPLNAIIGFAEVMIEERFGPVENERYREYLRDIRTSGEHVVSLVNDLLDISKIEAGKLDLSFSAVPLNELVRECVTLMQPQANRAKVIVRSSLASELPSIVADPRTMRQVVLNLLSNSIKFTGSGGQVIVSTTLTDSGEAMMRVRDTGTGMSEEDLARALEPFRQLSTSRIGDENGTGLGLPLTKALVEANRADFEISSARGEGTIVQVTFPATRVLSE